MAKVKSPRSGSRSKKILAMPEGVNSQPPQLVASSHKTIPIDLESEIRRRAYQIYEERGRTSGDERQDWVVAEREVLARYDHQQSA